MTITGHLHLAGAWEPGDGPPASSTSPVDGSTVWSGREASAEQVDRAVRAAAAAFAGWSGRPLGERVGLVRRFATLLGEGGGEVRDLMVAEVGKVRWDAEAEVGAMVAKADAAVDAHAERTGTATRDLPAGRLVTEHRPHGPMVVLGPFNFPGHLANGHIMPALVAGNTVVLKPSELAPATSEAIVRLWERAGAPPGVVNLVQGGVEVAGGLIDHPATAGVLFTGSVEVGRSIHQRLAGRPEVIVALELGGNNPLIAWDVSDVAAAARLVVRSAFTSAGQRCTCARRLVLADGPAGDAVLDALAHLTGRLPVGRPHAEPAPFLGPVVSTQAAQAVLDAQDALIAAGGIPLVTAHRVDHLGPAYVSPGVLDVTAVADRPDTEIFGPLLQVIRVPTLDAAIAEANDTRFGLAGGVLSDDPAVADRVEAELRAGVISRNAPTVGASGLAPFGGVGASGNHRPAGWYAADYCAYPVARLGRDTVADDPSPLPGLDR
jgi:succinylglutamic semialdehyde dehydrogenase